MPRYPALLPGLDPIWRDDDVLQLGLGDEPLLLTGVPRRLETVVKHLDGEHSPSDLAGIAGEDWVSWLLEVLARHDALAVGRSAAEVRVVGAGDVALGIAHGLVAAGTDVRLLDPDGRGLVPEATAAVRRSGGGRVGVDHGWHFGLAPVELTILATPTLECDRTLTDMLRRQRTPYLVVRVQPGRAVVGPLVTESTSCLRCYDLVRTRADPGWPRLLARLVTREHPVDPALASWAIAVAVRQALAYLAGSRTEVSSATLEARTGDGITRWRRWPRHPSCDCGEAA